MKVSRYQLGLLLQSWMCCFNRSGKDDWSKKKPWVLFIFGCGIEDGDHGSLLDRSFVKVDVSNGQTWCKKIQDVPACFRTRTVVIAPFFVSSDFTREYLYFPLKSRRQTNHAALFIYFVVHKNKQPYKGTCANFDEPIGRGFIDAHAVPPTPHDCLLTHTRAHKRTNH